MDDIATMSYEQARDELVAVVAELEAGNATLEKSLALWERGEALAARCQEWLDTARTRLDEARAAHAVPSGSGAGTASGAATGAGAAALTDDEVDDAADPEE